MRSARLLVLLALAMGCAHGGAPRQPEPRAEVTFELRHAPEDEDAAAQVRRALARAVPAAQRFGALAGPVVVTVHESHERLEAAAHRQGLPWLRAWARAHAVELQSPRTWSRGGASDDALAQLLTHELTHCAMYQALGRQDGQNRGIPLWFREGMATFTAGERPSPPAAGEPAGTLEREAAGATGAGGRPSADAERPRQSPAEAVYAAADRAFRRLVERGGEARIRRLLAAVGAGREFAGAFHEVMGAPLAAMERELGVTAAEGTRASPAGTLR